MKEYIILCVLDEGIFFREKGTILENVTDSGVLLPVRGVTTVGNPQNDSAS